MIAWLALEPYPTLIPGSPLFPLNLSEYWYGYE
jgi:hypothetical protein